MSREGFPNSSPLHTSTTPHHSTPHLPLVANSGGWSMGASVHCIQTATRETNAMPRLVAMGVTPKQAWAIAHLVAELRPEWQAEGVVAAIKRVADRNPAVVALAAVRAAADPDARTPGVIPTDGTHWQDGIKEQPGRGRPPRKDEECDVHAGQWADACQGCAADRLVGDKTLPANLRRPEVSHHLSTARSAIAQARADLCPCGVPRTHCADHRDEPTA